MAKGKYRKWLEPDGLVLLEGWARDGLTNEGIADNVGVNVATLYQWQNKYHEIREALKKGKEIVDYQVENALLQSALCGNTTAQIFWLKNRRPDKWRDKPEAPEKPKEENNLFAVLEEALDEIQETEPEAGDYTAVVDAPDVEAV